MLLQMVDGVKNKGVFFSPTAANGWNFHMHSIFLMAIIKSLYKYKSQCLQLLHR